MRAAHGSPFNRPSPNAYMRALCSGPQQRPSPMSAVSEVGQLPADLCSHQRSHRLLVEPSAYFALDLASPRRVETIGTLNEPLHGG